MKVTTNAESDFRPITLTIVLDSREELEDLYHRSNIPGFVMNDQIADNAMYSTEITGGCLGSSSPLWKELYDIVMRLGYVK